VAAELVRNVSDTARWVATYRARESARKDALFHDPLAERLAGERGRAIADRASKHARWSIVTRTKLIDDLVQQAVSDGCDHVLDLAAGFDTRPYRMPLPHALVWVEADLAPLIEEKNALLAEEKPRCTLVRKAVDLADPAARAQFLAEATRGAKEVAVLTEGLVIYLDDALVAELARAFSACAAIRYWILDFNSPRIQREMMKSMSGLLGNAPFKFAPPNGVAFFEELGWKPRNLHSLFHEGARLKRVPLWMRPFARLHRPDPRDLKEERWTGVVRLERT
jgi:methyltransferase (TIGR00027 family)